MRLASGRSSAIRSVARLDRRTLAPATVPPIARYATLVGPTSLIPGQKHPLPPPPPPSPFPDPAPSHLPLDAPFAKTKAKAQDGKALPTKDAPPSVVRPSSLSPLDIYLLSWMRLLRPGAQPTLSELLDQMRERDHRQLDLTLDYEPTPSEDRRISPEDGTLAADGRLRKPIWMAEQEKLVRMASAVGTGQPIAGPSRSGWAPSTIDDGVVLLAHIFPSPEGQGPPRLVTCHGVALKTSDGSRLVATCAHPLSHLSSRLSAVPAVPSPIIPITSATGLAHAESASILFTPSGSVHPVTGVATCLGSADILVLEVGDRISASPTKEATAWRTAPVNPYPAPLGTRVWAHRFSGAGEAESKGRWDAAEIMEYKDDMGLAAKVPFPPRMPALSATLTWILE